MGMKPKIKCQNDDDDDGGGGGGGREWRENLKMILEKRLLDYW